MPYQVADRPEARLGPRAEEGVHLAPAVEANAEAVRLEDAVKIIEGTEDGFRIGVVGNASSEAVAIAHTVWRVREDQIRACRRQVFEDVEAVAVDDAMGSGHGSLLWFEVAERPAARDQPDDHPGRDPGETGNTGANANGAGRLLIARRARLT